MRKSIRLAGVDVRFAIRGSPARWRVWKRRQRILTVKLVLCFLTVSFSRAGRVGGDNRIKQTT